MLIKFISNFLASRLLSVVLFAAVAGVGTFAYYKIKHIGALESANNSLSNAIIRYEEKEALYNKLDTQLNKEQRRSEKALLDIRQQIKELKESSNEIKTFMSMRVPSDLVVRMCEQGYYSERVCASYTEPLSD